MQEVPLYSRPVKVLAIPLFWASSKNALLRANTKPPVQLVVVDFSKTFHGIVHSDELKYKKGYDNVTLNTKMFEHDVFMKLSAGL